MRRVLVGTIGYENLRDFSIGPKLLPSLRAIDWPQGVDVEEMNWGPIAIVQNFEAMTTPYDRIVLLAANQRGWPAGTITMYRWDGGLPSTDEIQDRVSEAVTGVISLDNLLIVGEYFEIWPDEVIIIDVEPGPEESGETFTPAVDAVVPAVLETMHHAALEDVGKLSPMEQLRGDNIDIRGSIMRNEA